MKKPPVSLLALSVLALAMSPVEAVAGSDQHVVTFRVSGEVAGASVTGGWDDLGITTNSAWYGFWSFDADATDSGAPPGTFWDAGFDLQFWIDGHEFGTLSEPRYCLISYDSASGFNSIYHAFDYSHGGMLYTPWDVSGGSRRTSADFFSMRLEDVVIGAAGPGGLPYGIQFNEPSPEGSSLHIWGTLGLDSFNYELTLTEIELVPEPSSLAMFSLGLLALTIARPCRRILRCRRGKPGEVLDRSADKDTR